MIQINRIKQGARMLLPVFVLATLLSLFNQPTTYAGIQPLFFPVIGSSSYSNDFAAPRGNGQHKATDIIANKGQKIVSASNGTIRYVTWWEGAGYSVRIQGTDGFIYNYYHINNDTPGTDDGKGGYMNAFAADIKAGNPIVKGQLLGYVGDSGNSETTVPHLHFEIYDITQGGSVGNPAGGGKAINPYTYLNNAQRISKPFNYPQLPGELLPYGLTVSNPMSIAIGNLDGTADEEMVTGLGTGNVPQVKVFKQSAGTQRLALFYAYDKTFTGGVDVAVGNVMSDSANEIVTGTGKGGGPDVRVFSSTGTLLRNFHAFDKASRTGINVAVGNVIPGGNAEIIVTPASGADPHVKVFDSTGLLLHDFAVYGATMSHGVDVAVGDITGDTVADIVVAPGKGAKSDVQVFSAAGVKVTNFYAYDESFRGGVRVSVANVATGTLASEIVAFPASGGPFEARVYNANKVRLSTQNFYESWWRGSTNDVAAGTGNLKVTTGGNRRASLR